MYILYICSIYIKKMEVLTAPNKNLRHLVSPKIENKQPVYHHTVLHWSQLYMLNRYRNRNKQFFILLFSGWTWRLCICSKNEGMLGNRQSVSLSCADLWKHKMSPFSSCKIKNKTTFFSDSIVFQLTSVWIEITTSLDLNDDSLSTCSHNTRGINLISWNSKNSIPKFKWVESWDWHSILWCFNFIL